MPEPKTNVSNAFIQGRTRGLKVREPISTTEEKARRLHLDNKRVSQIFQAETNLKKAEPEIHSQAQEKARYFRLKAHRGDGTSYHIKLPAEVEKKIEVEGERAQQKLRAR